jgi:hypothetical protein
VQGLVENMSQLCPACLWHSQCPRPNLDAFFCLISLHRCCYLNSVYVVLPTSPLLSPVPLGHRASNVGHTACWLKCSNTGRYNANSPGFASWSVGVGGQTMAAMSRAEYNGEELGDGVIIHFQCCMSSVVCTPSIVLASFLPSFLSAFFVCQGDDSNSRDSRWPCHFVRHCASGSRGVCLCLRQCVSFRAHLRDVNTIRACADHRRHLLLILFSMICSLHFSFVLVCRSVMRAALSKLTSQEQLHTTFAH